MTGWLLDTLLYTGVLIALVLMLRRPVSHHFGPQIAYMLWGLPFLRLLLPPRSCLHASSVARESSCSRPQ